MKGKMELLPCLDEKSQQFIRRPDVEMNAVVFIYQAVEPVLPGGLIHLRKLGPLAIEFKPVRPYARFVGSAQRCKGSTWAFRIKRVALVRNRHEQDPCRFKH